VSGECLDYSSTVTPSNKHTYLALELIAQESSKTYFAESAGTIQQQISALETPQYNAGQVHQNGMEYSVDRQNGFHDYGADDNASLRDAVSGLLTQVIGSRPNNVTNTAPGLRLNGTYAAPGGLKIEFREDSRHTRMWRSAECRGLCGSP